MSSETLPDEALLSSIQESDVGALEQLYDRHRVLAYSLALRTLGNPSEAEDVVQESFLSVWRAAGTYRAERSTPRSWLLSIVHHRAIDKLRGRQTRVPTVALEEGMDVPDRSDVWNDVVNRLSGEDVRSALSRLPSEQRETIEMAYFQGFTHSQIAERMDVPLGTVKGRMRIGLHKLRSLLEQGHTEMAVD
jgi:RNA polymerase sigma-70 factor, ECF subfamily